MFCEECGKEIPDEATFCSHCGCEVKSKVASSTNASNGKNMILALIISFILTGLGIAYAGNIKKGIILFVVGFLFSIIGIAVPICSAIGIIIWAYALYETYNEVRRANGENNPNLIEDIKGFETPKKIGSIIVIAIIFLIVIGGVIGAFAPKNTVSNDVVDDYDVNDDVDSVDVSSDSASSSSSSSSGSGDSYSSSSDGHDTYSHYEGEYGSSDTHGTVHDDGSVDAHQTGHTDYGDYEIDSHMDSDGNIHGTVEVGGKTYHVSN